MQLTKEQTNTLLDFIDQMGDLVEHVKRMERGSGLIENLQKALEISDNAKINQVRSLVLSGQQD